MADPQLKKQLQGYHLTTAEILYHLPDYPTLLQSYIWQEYDMAPKFPHLNKFLDFWSRNLEGTLSEIRVANHEVIQPVRYKFAKGVMRIGGKNETPN